MLISAICSKMFLLAVVIAHYGACGLRHITSRVQSGEGDVSAYVDDLLCVLTWLLGNGEWPHEHTAISFYAVAVLLVGIFLSLYILTNMFLVIFESRLTANCEPERKPNALGAKMKKLDLPSELQDRIQQYYSYLWQEYDAFTGDLNAFARDLTRPLALELGLCRYVSCAVSAVLDRLQRRLHQRVGAESDRARSSRRRLHRAQGRNQHRAGDIIPRRR